MIIKVWKCKFCDWETSTKTKEHLINHVKAIHPLEYGEIFRLFGERKEHYFPGWRRLNVDAA